MKRVAVIVAVVSDGDGRILIARRPAKAHQGGLWEFPGGKIEADESAETALARELREEVGIRVQTAAPFLQIRHDYADKAVLLDVWRVTQFEGRAHGREGQPVRWIPRNELAGYDFPAANAPILQALTDSA